LQKLIICANALLRRKPGGKQNGKQTRMRWTQIILPHPQILAMKITRINPMQDLLNPQVLAPLQIWMWTLERNARKIRRRLSTKGRRSLHPCNPTMRMPLSISAYKGM
jgi:hypothetical protein